MSGDDIVFDGDVAFREPKKLRRPDFDRRYACLDCDVRGPDDLPIFLDRKPADAIERHALRDTSVELGGILLGKECVDEETGTPFVWITEALEARHYENTQASFTYTHDSWQEITRERDQKHPELDIVGWYHTHPDFGVFLSSHDLFIHHNFFDQPLQVAYVVDPVRQTRGFFRWRGAEMAAVGGFTLTADRSERQALARLANELEMIPNTESAGGAISPRLEAELIAMLNRPSHPAASVDRSLLVAAVPMVCLVLGALLTAGVVWLNSLSQSMHDQASAVKDLGKLVDKAVAGQPSTLDAERLRTKEELLDILLGDVRDRPANTPTAAQINATLSKLAADREAIGRKFQLLETDRVAHLDRETVLLDEKKAIKKELDKLDEDSKAKIKELTESLDDRKNQVEEFVARLDERDKLIEDTKAGRLETRYNVAWYTAAGALALCVLLTGVLIATIARSTPTPPEPTEPTKPTNPEPPRVIIS